MSETMSVTPSTKDLALENGNLASIKTNTDNIITELADITANTTPPQLGVDAGETLGESGPVQQHEKESPNYPARELLTFDTNLQNVFGTQRLISDDTKKLKVESSDPDHLSVSGYMNLANTVVTINLNGQATVGIQLIGTWAGTITFQGSLDIQTWYAWSCRANLASTTQSAISSTGNGIWQANVAGLRAFRVIFGTYTSGVCQAILNASFAPLSHQTAMTTWNYGSQSVLHSQRPSSVELATHDSALREAFYIPEPWNPNLIYFPGDMVTWMGRNYRCIAQTANGTYTTYMPGTTYWTLEIRPNRSTTTNAYVSQPDAPRVRVEIDMDGYQYRLSETQMVQQNIQAWNDLLSQDALLAIQQERGGANGKSYYLGSGGSSKYTLEEIR